MNAAIKLPTVIMCAVFTFGIAVGIHSAWQVMTPFWARLATGAGVIGVFAWWIVTAFVLNEDWRPKR